MTKNKIVKCSAIIFGLCLFVNAITMMFIVNFSIGIIPLFALAVVFILCGAFFDKFKWIKRLYIVAVCGVMILGVLSVSLTVYGGHDDVSYDEDALIVLGSGIRGEKILPNLANRLDKAIEYCEKNERAVIVVSGGQGNQESISEAEAMKRYLVSKGIPADRIIKEDKSTSTYENFLYSSEILRERFEKTEVAFVTNKFHVYRAERMAKSLGIHAAHLGAKVEWYTAPMNYLREILAVAKTLVK